MPLHDNSAWKESYDFVHRPKVSEIANVKDSKTAILVTKIIHGNSLVSLISWVYLLKFSNLLHSSILTLIFLAHIYTYQCTSWIEHIGCWDPYVWYRVGLMHGETP